jgi:hypothetical protein
MSLTVPASCYAGCFDCHAHTHHISELCILGHVTEPKRSKRFRKMRITARLLASLKHCLHSKCHLGLLTDCLYVILEERS